MHHRIIAFFISNNKKTSPSYKRAAEHLEKLAASFARQVDITELENYRLHLVYEGELDELLRKDGSRTSFCVGPYTARKNSGWDFSFEKRKKIRDRFLSVSIEDDKITIDNDYIGSIPVYYSLRNAVTLSNIEPVAVLDSNTVYEDISPEAVYVLFHYIHLIGTETFYRHIRTQEPDFKFIYTADGKEPEMHYKATVASSEERVKMKDSDIIEEFRELNRMLVQETLYDGEDIVFPLSSGYDSRMILAAAIEDSNIKSRLRCYTYTPNMSLETRPAKELCEIAGVSWEKIQLPVASFSMRHLEQSNMVFGGGIHVHGKYKLDFIDGIKDNFVPGKSVIAEGFMTRIFTGSSFLCDSKISNEEPEVTYLLDRLKTSQYLDDNYLFAHSRILGPEIKASTEPVFQKTFDRFDGPVKHKMIMVDIWNRERNFYSYQPRIIEWRIPYIAPHVSPEFLNFTLSLDPVILANRKLVEMLFSTCYPELNRPSTNSNLSVSAILKRSFARPREGCRHYAPLLMKYFFKMPGLLPKKMIAEMRDPVIPDLRCIGKDGVCPLFDLNAESREVFGGYFDWDEVNNLFTVAMTGDQLATKRLMLLETLACALKLLEK